MCVCACARVRACVRACVCVCICATGHMVSQPDTMACDDMPIILSESDSC